jgi:hypothetical protein
MPDPQKPVPFDPLTAKRPEPIRTCKPPDDKTSEKVLCDRCGAEVYRMHAVWRCPECGFKSDCCGW